MSSPNRKHQTRYANLRAWRDAKGFTLEEAAEYLGEPLTNYYEWERGNRRPKPDAMRHIIDRTGVRIEFLAGVA